MVQLARLELATSRLSAERSDQLSYSCIETMCAHGCTKNIKRTRLDLHPGPSGNQCRITALNLRRPLENGGSGRVRTYDARAFNATLYQLSYQPKTKPSNKDDGHAIFHSRGADHRIHLVPIPGPRRLLPPREGCAVSSGVSCDLLSLGLTLNTCGGDTTLSRPIGSYRSGAPKTGGAGHQTSPSRAARRMCAWALYLASPTRFELVFSP